MHIGMIFIIWENDFQVSEFYGGVSLQFLEKTAPREVNYHTRVTCFFRSPYN